MDVEVEFDVARVGEVGCQRPGGEVEKGVELVEGDGFGSAAEIQRGSAATGDFAVGGVDGMALPCGRGSVCCRVRIATKLFGGGMDLFD